MNEAEALQALAALAQDTRLAIVRQLVRAGADGRTAGEMADALAVRQNTLSTHLQKLEAARLYEAVRPGDRPVALLGSDAPDRRSRHHGRDVPESAQ